MRTIYWQFRCAECESVLGYMTSGMLPYVVCPSCKESLEQQEEERNETSEN